MPTQLAGLPTGGPGATLSVVATYVIGDVQGCALTLRKLARRVRFDEAVDRVVLVGDLVNRGPDSLGVLRWAMERGGSVEAVLGNHDLHLVARLLGLAGPRRRDTLEDVLHAPDRDEILDWLRSRPFVHACDRDHLVVHAGILPVWSADEALTLGGEAGRALRGPGAASLLASLHERPALAWKSKLAGEERLRAIVQAMTQIRTCDVEGRPDFDFKGAPEKAPRGLAPWFERRSGRSADATVVFGHWAALGFHRAPLAVGIDTGAVWGRELTALRLDDDRVFSEPVVDELAHVADGGGTTRRRSQAAS